MGRRKWKQYQETLMRTHLNSDHFVASIEDNNIELKKELDKLQIGETADIHREPISTTIIITTNTDTATTNNNNNNNNTINLKENHRKDINQQKEIEEEEETEQQQDKHHTIAKLEEEDKEQEKQQLQLQEKNLITGIDRYNGVIYIPSSYREHIK